MSTTKSLFRVPMTDKPPLAIRRKDWPIIAHAHIYERENLTVRQHADGRVLVYGTLKHGYRDVNNHSAGEMTQYGSDMITTLKEVSTILGFPPAFTQQCVNTLPPEVID